MISLNSTAKALGVAVTEALTKVLSVKTFKYDQLAVQVAVAGQALDQFAIKGKVHKDGAEVTLFSTAEEYGTPAGLLKECSGDLTTIAAAGTGWFILNVANFHEINVYAASGNVAGSTVDVFASLR